MTTKRCSKCGRDLPRDQFSKCKRNRDGLDGWCKECHKAYDKQHYKANRKKIADRKKQYRENNREKIAACNATPSGRAAQFLRNERHRGVEIDPRLTNEQVAALYTTYDIFGIPNVCRGMFRGRLRPLVHTIAHIIPVAIGGKTELKNLCLMCNTANVVQKDCEITKALFVKMLAAANKRWATYCLYHLEQGRLEPERGPILTWKEMQEKIRFAKQRD